MDLHVPVTARDHVRGAPHGRVTLVEYGDFDCPFCAEAYPVVRALLGQFEKQLRFVFRPNPRGELHPHARLAAQAAEAAALQGQFWPMHDLLFEHSGALEEPALLGYAQSLGLERSKFEAALHSPEIRAHVREDEVGGLHSGVIGTPTFFINGLHFRDKPDLATLGGALAALIGSGS
jgi:protein-disulfide isomerase